MAAAFSSNRCLWRGCGRIYSSLYDLIEHVEEYHIETDATFLERQDLAQPPALPLSYICRFYPPGYTRRRRSSSGEDSTAASAARFDQRRSSWDSDPFFSDGSNGDEPGAHEYTSESIIASMSTDVDAERPFVCPVPGCRKRYKNVNGIKYHAKHGHPRERGRSRCARLHACGCGKSFKTSTALRHHYLTEHVDHPAPVTPTTPTATTPTSPPYAGIPAPPYVFPQALPPPIAKTSTQRSIVHVPVMGQDV